MEFHRSQGEYFFAQCKKLEDRTGDAFSRIRIVWEHLKCCRKPVLHYLGPSPPNLPQTCSADDALENILSTLRTSILNNTHPPQHEIIYLTAHFISMKIRRDQFKHKASNCDEDKDEMVVEDEIEESRLVEI